VRANQTEILENLIAIFPAFAIQWSNLQNDFRADDGSFTLCGLFSEFSSFYRDGFTTSSPLQHKSLFALIENCVDDSGDDLDTAACTCFLENISGEGDFSNAARSYMGSRSRKFFDWWNHS
jgi:hypothetical protein